MTQNHVILQKFGPNLKNGVTGLLVGKVWRANQRRVSPKGGKYFDNAQIRNDQNSLKFCQIRGPSFRPKRSLAQSGSTNHGHLGVKFLQNTVVSV